MALTTTPISTEKHLKEADNLIVLSKDGHMEGQGSFEELVGKNQYILSLSCSAGLEHSDIEESDSSLGQTQEANNQVGETRERETTSNILRGGGDISLYSYYINSLGWWAFGLTLLFASLYVFCTAFPREYT
jgi:hypothetical protein